MSLAKEFWNQKHAFIENQLKYKQWFNRKENARFVDASIMNRSAHYIFVMGVFLKSTFIHFWIKEFWISNWQELIVKKWFDNYKRKAEICENLFFANNKILCFVISRVWGIVISIKFVRESKSRNWVLSYSRRYLL